MRKGKKEKDIIKRVISILDSVDYAHYSDGRARNYLEYALGTWVDEDKLIAPIIFPKFLERVLGFKLGENIGTQEAVAGGRDTPDFIPVDTRTHPFVFDCKGMDTEDLSKWYAQIKRYMEPQGLKYGILTNMRDLDVYILETAHEIEAFNFNFVNLYKDYKENLVDILEIENTKRFLRFVERFRYIQLTVEQKFERVAEAKPWTGKETLNIDVLTKRLRHIVECIHEDAAESKEDLLSLREVDPERVRAIAQEIELIASEIQREREGSEASVETFDEIMRASPESILGRALDIFFYRIGYFTMTRLLLARAWEDIGFIDQSLYDGGLAKWYGNFDREIRRVLHYAFGRAAERYKWLFNIGNNYTWYEPSDDTLIEALYELSNFNLGKLNQDVLGTIYEEYIDKVDKRQKGQYYTPREIIEFIWNRVGFTNPKAFFWHIKGKRRPRFIFDPAAGSGGFLVEAARRIREESSINWNDFHDLNDVRYAIVSYIFGSEISIFPYYITEVNLLIQLTPVVKQMINIRKSFREPLPLGILPVDSLQLFNPKYSLLPEKEYEADHIRDLLPLESQKRAIFGKIKKEFDERFSYCCANPPYIGEKGNKELFRSTLERFPYWRKFYQGKMDYLYFFIILGLSKLRNPGERTPGGKLGFITTAYWPTADGASKLRQYILENAKIKEVILFGDIKIFEYAKGQHNMVFILEKCAGKDREKERAENRIKIVETLAKHRKIPGDSIRQKLRFLTSHFEKHIGKSDWQDQYIKVFWSGVTQGQLPHNGDPWNDLYISFATKGKLSHIEERAEPLKNMCDIIQGIVSGTDAVTGGQRGNIHLLPEKKIKKYGIKVGDGIFVLTEEEKLALDLSHDEDFLLKKTYKNSDICQYLTDLSDYNPLYVIYVKKKNDMKAFPSILAHLEKFKEILEERLKRYEEDYDWYCLHRERDESVLSSSFKIVTPRWGEELKPFSLQTGEFYENSDINVIVPKDKTKEDIMYLLGLLNSSLVKWWMTEKARQKGLTRQSILFKLPVHRIDFDNHEEVKLHGQITEKVKAIRKKIAELATYSKYFREVKLTQLKPQDALPGMNSESIIQALMPEKRFSLRTHPDIKINYGHHFEDVKFILSKTGNVELTLEGSELKLIGKDRKVVFLKGAEQLLGIISSILENHKNDSWTSIKELPIIPENVEDYEDKKAEIIENVVTLRTQIQTLQTSIDEMVLQLYGIPKDFVKMKYMEDRQEQEPEAL
ncbi:MAG: N-6 DNA methylase [Candidatus Hodarchaeota archaeon]